MLSDWFKSRYTRSLEERVIELKLEIAKREEQILSLKQEIKQILNGRIIELEATRPPLSAADIARLSAERKRGPRSVNFIQGRDWMEEQSKAGHEIREVAEDADNKAEEA